MSEPLDLSEHKRRLVSVYNLASAGYDNPALRFFLGRKRPG